MDVADDDGDADGWIGSQVNTSWVTSLGAITVTVWLPATPVGAIVGLSSPASSFGASWVPLDVRVQLTDDRFSILT